MNDILKRKKESFYMQVISKIIHEDVTNVNIYNPTVTDVNLSKDGSYLKVYFVFSSNKQKSLIALNSSKGFIRSQLAKYNNSRQIPKLIFEIDDLREKTSRIDDLFREIERKNEEK